MKIEIAEQNVTFIYITLNDSSYLREITGLVISENARALYGNPGI